MKELEGLQGRLVEMLLQLREFTNEHGLTFFLVGGRLSTVGVRSAHTGTGGLSHGMMMWISL